MSMTKNWCVTIHLKGPQETPLDTYMTELHTGLMEILDITQVNYLIFGLECGETTNAWHLQGYLQFSTRKRMTTVKQWLQNPQAHLELARGTPTQNRVYCTKENRVVWEYGEISEISQGKRSDLDDCVDKIKEGCSIRVLWEQNTKTMIRYHQGLTLASQNLQKIPARVTHPIESYPQAWQDLLKTISEAPKQSVIIWGEPGLGKTSIILSSFPMIHVVSHMDDLLRYQSDIHQGILFDDMEFTHLPRTSQIHLTDQEVERSIHCRFRTAQIPAGTLKIFTTNIANGACFDLNDKAIKRRVKVHQLIKI